MSESNHHDNHQDEPFSPDEAAKLSEVSIVNALLCQWGVFHWLYYSLQMEVWWQVLSNESIVVLRKLCLNLRTWIIHYLLTVPPSQHRHIHIKHFWGSFVLRGCLEIAPELVFLLLPCGESLLFHPCSGSHSFHLCSVSQSWRAGTII